MKIQKISIACFIVLMFMPLQASTLLATVNGHNITSEVAGENFAELRDELKEMKVKKLVEKELAIEYAMKSDIMKSDNFKKSFDHIVKMSQKGINTEAKSLKEALVLTDESISKEQLRSKKGLLAFDMLLDEKAKTIFTDDEVLKEFYKANFLRYNMPKLYEISHIVVNTKAEADAIVKELDEAEIKGKTFHDLALKHSLAPSKEDGGYLGQYDLEAMNSMMVKEVENLPMGMYSKSVKTEFGYEIIFLIGKQEAKKMTFEQAKKTVKRDYVKHVVIEWAFKEIEKLKENSEIKYYSI